MADRPKTEWSGHDELPLLAREVAPLADCIDRLFSVACEAVGRLCQSGHCSASSGRVRGTGPGVSFSALVAALEHEFPVTLQFPFEGSERVGGAVWDNECVLGASNTNALAKLRWEPGATDLPMHAHEHSDRFIIVLEGRGFFHVTDQPAENFDGNQVRTIAARARDVFCFRRGTVHTFSTFEHGMTLLSCQLPFIPFDDPRQYTLPACRWTARERVDTRNSGIVIAGWTRLV